MPRTAEHGAPAQAVAGAGAVAIMEVPEGKEERAAEVVRAVMSGAAEPALELDVPLDVEVGWGRHWGAAH